MAPCARCASLIPRFTETMQGMRATQTAFSTGKLRAHATTRRLDSEMAWPTPRYSRNEVNRAGEILAADTVETGEDVDQWLWSWDVVTNWRACHGYTINTFRATLGVKLREIDKTAIVAQRLKRMQSIVNKLQRLEKMQLSRMQDIGGLRAVVSSMQELRALETNYRESRFRHELVNARDYVAEPKTSGYRSIHLVYRYKNRRRADYDGLLIELQLRTKIQHIWATAVETIGTFLNHALKASEGPEEWLEFFAITSAALAHLERTPPVRAYADLALAEVYEAVTEKAAKLQVRPTLLGFTVAANQVHADRRAGSYHLVILDAVRMTVTTKSFTRDELNTASEEYSQVEERIKQGERIQAVLVSAGPFENLRRAYPNYFLDSREFLNLLLRIESAGRKASARARQKMLPGLR